MTLAAWSSPRFREFPASPGLSPARSSTFSAERTCQPVTFPASAERLRAAHVIVSRIDSDLGPSPIRSADTGRRACRRPDASRGAGRSVRPRRRRCRCREAARTAARNAASAWPCTAWCPTPPRRARTPGPTAAAAVSARSVRRPTARAGRRPARPRPRPGHRRGRVGGAGLQRLVEAPAGLVSDHVAPARAGSALTAGSSVTTMTVPTRRAGQRAADCVRRHRQGHRLALGGGQPGQPGLGPGK